MYKVLWYREAAGSVEEPIVREKETPILLRGDSVLVKGWDDFDDTARETVVVFGESLNAGMDGRLHQSAHFEQRLFQFFEFFRKVAHGGLSRNVR